MTLRAAHSVACRDPPIQMVWQVQSMCNPVLQQDGYFRGRRKIAEHDIARGVPAARRHVLAERDRLLLTQVSSLSIILWTWPERLMSAKRELAMRHLRQKLRLHHEGVSAREPVPQAEGAHPCAIA